MQPYNILIRTIDKQSRRSRKQNGPPEASAMAMVSTVRDVRQSGARRSLSFGQQLLVVAMFLLTVNLTSISARKTRITWVNGIGYVRVGTVVVRSSNLGNNTGHWGLLLGSSLFRFSQTMRFCSTACCHFQIPDISPEYCICCSSYTLEHMVEGQYALSKYFGGKPIRFCHNPTSMAHEDDVRGYLTDLSQAGQQKLGRITAEVNTLVQHLQEAAREVGRRGRVIHIAHSQGALITLLATKRLTPDEMKRTEILCFGGAAALQSTPETPFARCINYYAVNDPLLLVVPAAANALRSGLFADDFCFLAPRGGDPVVDHKLCGPTYALALQWEGRRFVQLYVSPLYRGSRWLLLLLAAVAEIVQRRLQQVLWFLLVRPGLQFCAWAHQTTVLGAARLKKLVTYLVVRPILLWICWAWAWIQTNLRGEEKYEPVSKIIQSEESKH